MAKFGVGKGARLQDSDVLAELFADDESENELLISDSDSDVDDNEINVLLSDVDNETECESEVGAGVVGNFQNVSGVIAQIGPNTQIFEDIIPIKPEEWIDNDCEPNIPQFLGDPGLKFVPRNVSNCMDYLSIFLTEEFLEFLCIETNRYAEQFLRDIPRPVKQFSRFEAWTPVDVKEMKKFLGLIILTGIVKKPTLDMYWSSRSILSTPIFGATMPRNRFQLILKFLHFNNNEEVNEEDRLHKVRKPIDHFCNLFKTVYVPNQKLALDEGMLAWRGRLRFRVYNPSKIIKYGIMVRLLCESSTGYICTMQIYDGNCRTIHSTVTELLQPYENKGYHVYMDNFYNSVRLTQYLQNKNFGVVGTMRQNRGMPKTLVNISKSLKTGEMTFKRHGNILLQSWKDKRVVNMISTLHSAQMVEVASRRKQTNNLVRMKPMCIVDYNKYMHGVDTADQHLAYYPFLRKTVKWSKKLFFYLLLCSVCNSHALYKIKNPGKSLLDFTQNIVESLIENEAQDVVTEPVQSSSTSTPLPTPSTSEVKTKYPKRAPVHDPITRLDGIMKNHILVNIPPTQKKERPSRPCKVCLKKKKRSETKFICISCKIPLHVGDCFTRYHTLKNY